MRRIFIDVNCREKIKKWDSKLNDTVTDYEVFIQTINIDHIISISDNGILTTGGFINTYDDREAIINKLRTAGDYCTYNHCDYMSK